MAISLGTQAESAQHWRFVELPSLESRLCIVAVAKRRGRAGSGRIFWNHLEKSVKIIDLQNKRQ